MRVWTDPSLSSSSLNDEVLLLYITHKIFYHVVYRAVMKHPNKWTKTG